MSEPLQPLKDSHRFERHSIEFRQMAHLIHLQLKMDDEQELGDGTLLDEDEREALRANKLVRRAELWERRAANARELEAYHDDSVAEPDEESCFG